MSMRKLWTELEVARLKRRYPNTNNATLALVFGRPKDSIQKKATSLGLRKSDEHMKGVCTIKQKKATESRMKKSKTQVSFFKNETPSMGKNRWLNLAGIR